MVFTEGVFMTTNTLLEQAILSCLVPCPPLVQAKQQLQAGDWGAAVRCLLTVSEEEHGAGTRQRVEDLFIQMVAEKQEWLKAQWDDVFKGALTIDFVCANPQKMQLLQQIMEISDLVPMYFDAQPTDSPDKIRVSIEI